MKLDVPFRKQVLANSCFPAAVRMVLRHYGDDIDERWLYKNSTLPFHKGCWDVKIGPILIRKGYRATTFWDGTIEGWNPRNELVMAYKKQYREAIRLGLKHKRHASISLIKKFIDNNTPVLTEVSSDKLYGENFGYTHMIVIVGYDKKSLYFHDPDRKHGGKNKKVSFGKFKKCWEKISQGSGRSMFVIEKKLEHFPLKDRLHTDVLSDKYGKIYAKVLRHDNKIRESHLIDSKGISRTYALTFLGKNWPLEIKAIDKKLRDSNRPVGELFRKYDYEIRKNVIDVFVLEIPAWLRKEFSTKQKKAKIRLSEFYAKKQGSEPIVYGVVTEIYSPDFRAAEINKTDKLQISAPTKYLEKIGFSKIDIWNRIICGWKDMKEKHGMARQMSRKETSKLKKRVENYIRLQAP